MLADLPDAADGKVIETFFAGVRVAGSAELLLESECAARKLAAGDTAYVPAHCRHRVT
ncbi:MAG: hypothetical protein OSB67_06230 [Alphaproteobacteria bacterium]|nr:hypothetical protein [Alphaproteobacteria bacterium]